MTALTMTETLSDRFAGDSPQEHAAAIAEAFQHWGQDTITEAFGLLIGVGMSQLNEATFHDDDAAEEYADQPAPLRIVIPAVLTRFRRMQMPEVPEAALPTVAGILTAAVYGQNPYEWRTELGPISTREALIWCYIAWLMIDFIDEAVLEEPGGFARMFTKVVGVPDDDGDPQ